MLAQRNAVAWARQFPDEKVVLYGVIPMQGQNLVRLLSGIIVLFALHFGFYQMAAELAACALAAGYPRWRAAKSG